MEQYRTGNRTAEGIGEELSVSARRVRQLLAEYLQAVSEGRGTAWEPGSSGGHRQKSIPAQVEQMWGKMLAVRPPAPYGFLASEAMRRYGYSVDRATARRWAVQKGLEHEKPKNREPAAVRRWQSQQVGELWQLDASPHRWMGPESTMVPMLDMIDDCSRVITGTRLYPRECHLAYLDFLRQAFEEYGLPLQIYVDYHSMFFTAIPQASTYLAECLLFYDITFKYAPTPQAKGKIERAHLFWQNRLPSLALSEGVNDISGFNPLIQQLRVHHNQHETHRELNMTPQQAWDEAKRQKRCVLRPKPACLWWPYIWSVRSNCRVEIDGRVSAGNQRVRINRPPFSKVVRCEHPDGSFTFLAQPPGSGGKPLVLLRLGSAGTPWNV